MLLNSLTRFEQSWLLHRTFNPEDIHPRWVRVPEGAPIKSRFLSSVGLEQDPYKIKVDSSNLSGSTQEKS